MRKIMRLTTTLIITGLIVSCTTNTTREPQQVVGDIGDKSVVLSNTASSKIYSECWVEKWMRDSMGSNNYSFGLVGINKFAKTTLLLDEYRFTMGEYSQNARRYSRKVEHIIKIFTEEAQDRCDVLKPGIKER